MLVAAKQMATGSILRDEPQGNLRIWLTHIFNLFFLLIVNPLVAVLLILQQAEVVDPTHLDLDVRRLLMGLEAVGAVLHLVGFLLMVWALIRLGSNYQVGGSIPRPADEMVMDGPYGLVRHPVYTAALLISLGLACLTQSLACLAVFGVYLFLIVLLIPVEEEGLRRVYGKRYRAYQQRVKMLIPYLY